MERGHIPERTCRGCGCKKERAGLIRFVIRDGVLIEDQLRQKAGRGIYCCNDNTCRQRLARNRKLLKRADNSGPVREQERGVIHEQGSCI